MGEDWEKYFSVDSVSGQPVNELRFQGKVNNSIVALLDSTKGSRRLFALRKDFIPADKILAEDDIIVSDRGNQYIC